MRTIVQSRPARQGQDHSYALDPGVGPGCEWQWFINGQACTVGDVIGGLAVEGIGASGTLSVEVVGEVSSTRISAVVSCPGEASQAPEPVLVELEASAIEPNAPAPNQPPEPGVPVPPPPPNIADDPPPPPPDVVDPPPVPTDDPPPDPPEIKTSPNPLLDWITKLFRWFLTFLAIGGFGLLLHVLMWFGLIFPWLWSLPWFVNLVNRLWLRVYGVPYPPFAPPPPVPTPPIGPPIPAPVVPPPPFIPLCRVTSKMTREKLWFRQSGRVVVGFWGLSASPAGCVWEPQFDQYSVTPAIPIVSTTRIGNHVEIVLDTRPLAKGAPIVINAVWTCRCPAGNRSWSYDQLSTTAP